MILSFALLSARPDLDHDAFVDHYENRHVPLITRLAPPPGRYWRTYLPATRARTTPADFDVVTQLEFADREALSAWTRLVQDHSDEIAADEARFLDRARTRSWVVEVHGHDR